MTEPTIPVKVEPVDEVQETVVVTIPVASENPKPDGIITTNRKTPIIRGVPLKETHGMTTEANRFKEL